MYKAQFSKKTFQFKNPSGTSRGILTEKHAWFIEIWEDKNLNCVGLGECSIIPGLSPDFVDFEMYEAKLKQVCENISLQLENLANLREFPSILFGIETAFQDLQMGGKQLLFPTDFTEGKRQIPINGLIWMGEESFMLEQVEQKIAEGFSCIKMKVGAIDFEKEIKLLAKIRARFSPDKMILRVDANGAFSLTESYDKLKRLADLGIHSIEQPLKAGNTKEMAQLCRENILPIALDEELIGVHEIQAKMDLLDEVQPQYIILKPSLHGSFEGCKEWISLAEERQIPWWMTSALESNVGLNAIAQFTACFDNSLHQGLGTGSLYVQNTESQLILENGLMRSNWKLICK